MPRYEFVRLGLASWKLTLPFHVEYLGFYEVCFSTVRDVWVHTLSGKWLYDITPFKFHDIGQLCTLQAAKTKTWAGQAPTGGRTNTVIYLIHWHHDLNLLLRCTTPSKSNLSNYCFHILLTASVTPTSLVSNSKSPMAVKSVASLRVHSSVVRVLGTRFLGK